jgi:HNH endonuclease
MKRNIESDFWAKVDSSAGPQSCWPWLGPVSHNGYGRGARLFDRYWRAHRLAHFIATGEEPPVVCHRCDNPICCNPEHLFGGTQLDNVRDCWNKGRKTIPYGEKHPSAKRTEDQILAIRNARVKWPEEIDYLAAMFDANRNYINSVRRGAIWAHLT